MLHRLAIAPPVGVPRQVCASTRSPEKDALKMKPRFRPTEAHADANREFAGRGDGGVRQWFLVALVAFMILGWLNVPGCVEREKARASI
jgi:hypothetical protein